jgi:uncharacterized protein YbgA (DUF1722 family)
MAEHDFDKPIKISLFGIHSFNTYFNWGKSRAALASFHYRLTLTVIARMSRSQVILKA